MSDSTLPGESGFSLPWPAGRSEERLARRAAAGDKRAFAAIFRRYGPELHRYCLAIVGNRADAQDALQNVMVKALRSLPGERREIKLKPWLYRVAHNESVELLRGRQGEELDPETAALGAGLAETAEQRRRLRHLLADLEQLPERQRGALLMRELSGLDFEQIGAALGISAPAARQTAYEARLGLREMEAGREMSCDLVTKAISDGDGRALRRRDVRAHLRTCAECRAFRAGIDERRHDLAAVAPLPAVAVAGLLKGALGSSAGSAAAGGTAGGAAAGAGGGVAVGTGAAGGAGLVKAVAVVAVVAAVGAGAADRAGLVQIGDTGNGTAAKERVRSGAQARQTEPGRRAAAALTGAAAARRAAEDASASVRVGQVTTTPSASAEPASRLFPGRGDHGHEGKPAEPGGLHGKSLQGTHGSGPPAHSHAGGNSASAHANAGQGKQKDAEHRAPHSPAGSQGSRHVNGSKGQSTSHTATPPPSSPHKPAEPRAPQTESPAAGATEAKPAPEHRQNKGAAPEAEAESSS